VHRGIPHFAKERGEKGHGGKTEGAQWGRLRRSGKEKN